MKALVRTIFASVLAALARGILQKYAPTVVMVTGSVGKTSTKDATAAALSTQFNVRASEKSYNSEFGVPLTIIGAKNAWSNPLAWLKVFQEALALIMLPSHYPKLLVLEVGADRPGDLARILRIATPDAVIVTKLPEVPVHVEAYPTPEAVREEEFAPAYALTPGAPLIISSDDPFSQELSRPLPVTLTTYGTTASSDVRIDDAQLLLDEGFPAGMKATLSYEDAQYTLEVRGALGRQQLYAPAAAFAVAVALTGDPEAALAGLAAYVPPPGRSRILRGHAGAVLIDDSYNASPLAVIEALGALALLPGKRRIAVLGDMLELGRYSRQEHERIGKIAAESSDVVVAVGPRACAIAEAARAAGMPEDSALMFDTSYAAADTLREMVGEGDVVLVKGSQSIRMERVVERLLDDPKDAALLVRQDKEWKRR